MAVTNVLDGREIPVEHRLQEILSHLASLQPGENLVLIAPHEPAKLLRKLLVALPGRLNWAPLECGPQAWRWHFTGRDPDKPRTVTEYLCWDHRRLEAILSDTMALTRAAQWQDANSRMAEYAVGLRHHADIEEVILFTAYDDVSGNLPNGPTALMLTEHRDVRFGIDALERAIAAGDLDATEDALATLMDVTEQHHAKEEEILFPSMDESVAPESLTQLVERLLLG
ncbi:MAG: DUF2249 domain-containing protein [Planctomycetes bacterium]|nr:DUF2249 domain-containing protein [Planctomycetota bacterium]